MRETQQSKLRRITFHRCLCGRKGDRGPVRSVVPAKYRIGAWRLALVVVMFSDVSSALSVWSKVSHPSLPSAWCRQLESHSAWTPEVMQRAVLWACADERRVRPRVFDGVPLLLERFSSLRHRRAHTWSHEPGDVEATELILGLPKFVWIVLADIVALGCFMFTFTLVTKLAKAKNGSQATDIGDGYQDPPMLNYQDASPQPEHLYGHGY